MFCRSVSKRFQKFTGFFFLSPASRSISTGSLCPPPSCGWAPRPSASRLYRTVKMPRAGSAAGTGPGVWPWGRTAVLCRLLARALPQRVVVQCCSLWGFECGANTNTKNANPRVLSSFRKALAFYPIKSAASLPVSHYRYALAKRLEMID